MDLVLVIAVAKSVVMMLALAAGCVAINQTPVVLQRLWRKRVSRRERGMREGLLTSCNQQGVGLDVGLINK